MGKSTKNIHTTNQLCSTGWMFWAIQLQNLVFFWSPPAPLFVRTMFKIIPSFISEKMGCICKSSYLSKIAILHWTMKIGRERESKPTLFSWWILWKPATSFLTPFFDERVIVAFSISEIDVRTDSGHWWQGFARLRDWQLEVGRLDKAQLYQIKQKFKQPCLVEMLKTFVETYQK